MKTYSIAEINDLDHGIPISRFEGRIKKVFDQKQGEGQYGTWYLQNLIIEDGQQEITVTWTGNDPFHTDCEGEMWSFETGYDKKEKPVGIVRDIRTKNGKKYEGVKVDNRSKIKREGNGSAFQQTKAAMADHSNDDDTTRVYTRSELQQGTQDAPQSPVHAQQGEDGVMATRKHLMQSANLLVLCIRAADNAIAPNVPPIAQTTEFFLATVGKLYIEASGRRSDDNIRWWSYIDLMPTTPIALNGKKHVQALVSKEEEEDVPF